MIRRRNTQLALTEIVLATALGRPEDLMDPILRFIDAALNDSNALMAWELELPISEANDASTSGVSRKQIAATADHLTPEAIQFIHGALSLLLELPLNQMDRQITGELAGAETLSPRQAALGLELLTAHADILPAEVAEEIARITA